MRASKKVAAESTFQYSVENSKDGSSSSFCNPEELAP